MGWQPPENIVATAPFSPLQRGPEGVHDSVQKAVLPFAAELEWRWVTVENLVTPACSCVRRQRRLACQAAAPETLRSELDFFSSEGKVEVVDLAGSRRYSIDSHPHRSLQALLYTNVTEDRSRLTRPARCQTLSVIPYYLQHSYAAAEPRASQTNSLSRMPNNGTSRPWQQNASVELQCAGCHDAFMQSWRRCKWPARYRPTQ